MDKKYGIGAAAILATVVLGAGFVAAFPMGFMNPNKELTAGEIEAMHEQHQAVVEAIENEDYETWKSLMEKRIEEMKSELTEENFQAVVERHENRQEMANLRNQIRETLENEDYEQAAALREQMLEQMLENSPGFGGFGSGMKPRGGCSFGADSFWE